MGATITYVSATIFWEIQCSECGHIEGDRYNCPDEYAGDEWNCPNCGHTEIIDKEEFRDE